jgi:hypothetical protein
VSKKAKHLLTLGVAALAATLGLLSAALLGAFSSSPAFYLDGQGPLASTGNYGHASSEGEPALGPGYTGPRTLGFELCMRDSGPPAVIKSVSATQSIGDGYRILGMYARTIDLSTGDEAILSVDGFPPHLPLGSAHPDKLYPIAGYKVTARCSVIGHAYDELLIGLDAAPGQGGGWDGISVTYTVAGKTHTVRLPYRFFICGPYTIQRYSVCSPDLNSPRSPIPAVSASALPTGSGVTTP